MAFHISDPIEDIMWIVTVKKLHGEDQDERFTTEERAKAFAREAWKNQDTGHVTVQHMELCVYDSDDERLIDGKFRTAGAWEPLGEIEYYLGPNPKPHYGFKGKIFV